MALNSLNIALTVIQLIAFAIFCIWFLISELVGGGVASNRAERDSHRRSPVQL